MSFTNGTTTPVLTHKKGTLRTLVLRLPGRGVPIPTVACKKGAAIRTISRIQSCSKCDSNEWSNSDSCDAAPSISCSCHCYQLHLSAPLPSPPPPLCHLPLFLIPSGTSIYRNFASSPRMPLVLSPLFGPPILLHPQARGGHAWNVVLVDGKLCVCDVMYAAGKLYDEKSEKAARYQRLQ